MNKAIFLKFSLFLIFCSLSAFSQKESEILTPKYTITLGAAYGVQYYNKLQQAAETGTPILLGKFSKSNPLAYRFQLDYNLSSTQKLRILLSPFNETGSFTPKSITLIEGTQFNPNEPIKTKFGFNVLRIGLSNKKETGRFKDFKIGGTLIIRKWQASFKSASQNTTNENTIAVPLLFLGYEKNFGRKLFFNTEIDGLIVPFASVMEGGTAINYVFNKFISAGLQYRVLAGTYNSSDVKNKFSTQSLGLNTSFKF
jgi:hypothetical protein